MYYVPGTTVTPLRMLKGEGTATSRKNHHIRLTEVPLTNMPMYLICKELPGLLPKALCHNENDVSHSQTQKLSFNICQPVQHLSAQTAIIRN
jgi:hypothetical protein